MLHYFAKEFFAPVLVSPRIDVTNVVRVSVISDLFVNIPVILNLTVYRWDVLQPQYSESYNFSAVSNYSFLV